MHGGAAARWLRRQAEVSRAVNVILFLCVNAYAISFRSIPSKPIIVSRTCQVVAGGLNYFEPPNDDVQVACMCTSASSIVYYTHYFETYK
jgi:hypothetical protein